MGGSNWALICRGSAATGVAVAGTGVAVAGTGVDVGGATRTVGLGVGTGVAGGRAVGDGGAVGTLVGGWLEVPHAASTSTSALAARSAR